MTSVLRNTESSHSPYETLAIVSCLFCVGLILSKHVALLLGLTALASLASLIIGIACAILGYLVLQRASSTPLTNSWKLRPELAILIAAVFVYLVVVYWHGITLPANDPVADITYSSVLAKGIPLSTYYHVGENGNTYPPGVPLLLSTVDNLLGSIALLVSFKWLCIVCIGIMPLAWAWATRELFEIKVDLFVLVLAFYVSAFCIDRTLNYTLGFAGKNSQIIMLAMFPVFLVFTKRIIGLPWRHIAFPTILLTGLIFIHYSAIHLAFSILAIYVVHLWMKNTGDQRATLKWAAKATSIGALATVAFLFTLPSVIHNTPSTLGAKYHLLDSVKIIGSTFLASNNATLAIFNSHNFQSIASPLRGYMLIASVLICFAFRRNMTRNGVTEQEYSAISTAATCLFSSLVLSIALGAGLINTGVTLDYARWFSFPLQFSIIACLLADLLILATKNASKLGKASGIAGILLLPVAVFINDTPAILRAANTGLLFPHDIHSLASDFAKEPAGCVVISPNSAADSTNTMFAQKYRPLEYAEMSTECTLINGSWVHGPAKLWRDSHGIPYPAAYQTLKPDTAVYFVGSPTELATYGAGERWQKVGTLSQTGTPIWRKM